VSIGFADNKISAIGENQMAIDYQTEHLFLLIGRNPLPNYVAAKFLIKQGAKVYFVYSERTDDSSGTEDYKRRLVDKLKEQLGENFFTPIDVPLVSPSDATCIKNAIKNQFAHITSGSTIGLNYTGGTKAMSVHTYRAIEEFDNNKDCKLTFSYLDPRTLELRFDGNDEPVELNQPNTKHFEKTKIRLRALMDLHGLTFQQRKDGSEILPSDKVKFAGLVKVLSEYRNTENKWAKYQTFRNDNWSKLNYPDEQTQINLPVELSDLAIELNKVGQQVCRRDWVVENKLKFESLANNSQRKSLGMFLFSKWLESFVLQEIIAAGDKTIEDFGTSLYVARQENKTETFIEIDAFAVRGYQLFGISCSVAKDKDERKGKLFEIAHRAKQLGGDEARIGLVCMADAKGVNRLNIQLREDHIKVFGRDDLATLEIELRKWFKNE
jgi:hypothetical protein